jgi:hypothetical protein
MLESGRRCICVQAAQNGDERFIPAMSGTYPVLVVGSFLDGDPYCRPQTPS